MALPKIESPTFMLEVPSTKEIIKYRPFTVKEEKILLMASQGAEEREINSAIEQIINNCIVSDGLDLDSLSSYDIEYIFINLRSKSVNNIVELQLIDDEDGQPYKVEIDLDELSVTHNEEHEYNIELNEEVTILMKDPSYEIIKKIAGSEGKEDERLVELIMNSIEHILYGDEVLLMKDYTRKEQEEFINSFSSQNMRKIEKFFDTLPKLIHEVSYTRNDGETVTRTLEGVQSFFTW